MDTLDIVLKDDDPTVFFGCSKCNRKGRGVVMGDYYSVAYSRKQLRNTIPTCENCKTVLDFKYEVR